MEEPDIQETNRDSSGRWVKGKSGNLKGRPIGKTMKEWAKEYLSRMTDEERDEFMDGMPKEIIWKMSEGNPHSTSDAKVEVTQPIPIIPVNVQPNNSNPKDTGVK